MPGQRRPDLSEAEIARGIGRAIELLRVREGLSREDLAARADPPLSRSAILKIEKGERVPGAGTVARLAAALEVPIDVVLVTAWVAAEEDSTRRAERAKASLSWDIFGQPSAGVRAGALAGLGVIAILGAPIALGAAAAVAVGSIAEDHDRKRKDALEVQRLQLEVQRRTTLLTDPDRLQQLLQQLPDDDAGSEDAG
ncbi:MAG TPA: helix-turn-helix transcriptional regulator [Mycobacteriales bacterium]|nr:helix-turn-helix transcriptional regulator [Mycobacteriales bacterium]